MLRRFVVVGDRENDIYSCFARRPEGADLIVRAAQDRALGEDASLFASAAVWPELTQMLVKVAPRRIGDPGRTATVALRAGPVTLKRPRNGFAKTDPETVSMTLVEAREINPPGNEEPLHWRLLTTIEVGDAAAAREIVRLYRLRWRIDIDQAWRLSRIKGWVGSICNEAFWVGHRGSVFSSARIRAADRQSIADQQGRATPARRRGVRRARCLRD
jgi:hypothetical protein